jgi:hypothetical protein
MLLNYMLLFVTIQNTWLTIEPVRSLEYAIWSNVPLGIFYIVESLFMLALYTPCFIVILSAELQVRPR